MRTDEQDPARPAFVPRMFVWAGAVIFIVSAVLVGVLARQAGQPFRGFTASGFALGLCALLLVAGAMAYSARKRRGQEIMPGSMSTWLAWHLLFSIVAVALVGVHSGFHVDFESGSIALLLLLIATGSGVFGLYRYLGVPREIVEDEDLREARLLTSGAMERGLKELRNQRELKEAQIAAIKAQARRQPAGAPATSATAGLESDLDRLIAQEEKIDKALHKQASLRRKARQWLWLHIPASIGMLLAMTWHVAATWSTVFPADADSPADFQSARECRDCHERQFQEWSQSMHALAMQSPVTDIQNRLVLALEAEEKEESPSGTPKISVGDLCVRCHAPAAYVGRELHEELSAPIADRSEQSQEGVTCSVCHRIGAIHACGSSAEVADKTFRRCDTPSDGSVTQPYYNANNLVFLAGSTYFGPNGERATEPSVGNSYHRGLSMPHFGDGQPNERAAASPDQRSRLCASCHSVSVHDSTTGNRIVKLQDTYVEWACGREGLGSDGRCKGTGQWSNTHACTDCHNNPGMAEVAAQAGVWQGERMDLGARQKAMRDLMENHPVRSTAEAAVRARGGFDGPAPSRSMLTHSFVGVDVHLEPDLPGGRYPMFAETHSRVERGALTANARDATEHLLQAAAAIRIEEFSRSSGLLRVKVANLATGHKLPAGFAFAREMWIEVAVSNARSGEDNWNVVVGGKDGRALPDHEKLSKPARFGRDNGLRNYQAVLYSAAASDDRASLERGAKVEQLGREVVLQNQARDVLVGTIANELGFVDRVDPLFPGEAKEPRPVDLSALLTPSERSRIQRVRVRLRFRSLPVEFLEGLALEARKSGRGLEADAQRAENLVHGLVIFDMAKDEMRL